jgi:catechol 2,3-dioxygenase-like lactoylglutathione lyase family enzyme
MKHHLGRLIDHVHLRARDLEKTRRFYREVLGVLGIQPGGDTPDHIYFDELWIDALKEGEQGSATHVHLAFQAADRAAVDKFHAAGLAAGGRDNGKPGERDYHPGYYAAFLIDPDGNNVEAVYHGPAQRSAAAVEIEI